MSDFDEGLMIGLALGRKKGGGGGDSGYDNIFHDIIENYTKIADYRFGTHYTWGLGVWSSAPEYAPQVDNSGFYHIYNVMRGADNKKYACVEENYCGIYSVGVIYKDNIPVFACIINHVTSYYDSWDFYDPDPDNKDEPSGTFLFYKTTGDYNFEGVYGTKLNGIEPVFSSSFDEWQGYMNVDLSASAVYSYQPYKYDTDTRTVVKNGNRQGGGGNVSFGEVYPFGHYASDYARGHTDLDSDGVKTMIHEIIEEVYETAGYVKLNYSVLPTPD